MFAPIKRHRAYKRIFGSEDGKEVLGDLASYCKENDTTFHGSTEQMLIYEGRRQVFKRIIGHLKLNAEDVFNLERKLHERDSRPDGQ